MPDFSFGGINVASKKRVLNLRTTNDIVLADCLDGPGSFPVAILLEERVHGGNLRILQNFIERNGIRRYIILQAINVLISKDRIKAEQGEGIVKFYRDAASNFYEYIPNDAVILTSGPAVYSLTLSDDIYPIYAQEFIHGKAHFWYAREYDSPNGNWVYPIESFSDIFAEGYTNPPVDSYKTQLARFQMKAITSRSSSTGTRRPRLELVHLTTPDEFRDALAIDANEMAWDLETSGFSHVEDTIGCITWSYDGRTGYYANWNIVDTEALNAKFATVRQIGANLKFDAKFMWQRGITNARIDEDVVVLGHILDENRSNSLKTLAYLYTPWGGYDRALEEYKRRTKIDNYLDIPEDVLREYATMDSIVTFAVYKAITAHMKQLDRDIPNERSPWTMHRYYSEIRIPAVNAYTRMEFQGVYVSLERLKEARAAVRTRIDELQNEMATQFNVHPSFDFGSPTALGRLLEEMGWESQGRSKNGVYKCGDAELERWSLLYPEAKLIQEFRSSRVVLNSFLGDEEGTKGWTQYLTYHSEDDSWRMHSQYNVMGTDSGRGRSSNPNMQNVPSHGVFAKEVKASLATPNDDEYYMLTADMAGLQLRLAAADSQDAALTDIFSRPGADIHSETAFKSLVRNKEWLVEELEVECNGRTYRFLGGQIVKTQRGYIPARELTEVDTLL